MATRLPPLNALRTFEAAARHLSFTKAAEELFVTQTAVSHQIRALEEHLGAPLFRRMNRALMLTDQGQVLLPAVREAFDRLRAGVRRVEDLSSGGALTISTTPSFAASWLAGRLVRFQVLHPEIELQLGATSRPVDFAREGIDCGIRYGAGDWPGLVSQRLFRDRAAAGVQPEPAGRRASAAPAGGSGAAHPAARAGRHAMTGGCGCAPRGCRRSIRRVARSSNSIPLVLQAAINGAGVGIGRRQLVEAEVAAGRLVAPFDFELPDVYAYYFVVPEATADQPKLAAFRSWLMAEVASSAEAAAQEGHSAAA